MEYSGKKAASQKKKTTTTTVNKNKQNFQYTHAMVAQDVGETLSDA